MLAKYLNIKTLHLNYTFICFSYSGCFDHKKKPKKNQYSSTNLISFLIEEPELKYLTFSQMVVG